MTCTNVPKTSILLPGNVQIHNHVVLNDAKFQNKQKLYYIT